MIIQTAWELSLDFFKGREIVVEPAEAYFSGDATGIKDGVCASCGSTIAGVW